MAMDDITLLNRLQGYGYVDPAKEVEAATYEPGSESLPAAERPYQETPMGKSQELIDWAAGDKTTTSRPDEDVEIGALTDKMGEVRAKANLTVDDMTRAQAIDAIMSNVIKAFAAYRGFSSGKDMSGVDVKSGIDWNMALKGKLSGLEAESEELKGQREQKYRDLSSRIAGARELKRTETTEAERKQRDALDLYRLQMGEKQFVLQERRTAAMEKRQSDMEDKAAEGDKFKAQVGGTLSTYNAMASKASRAADEISKLAVQEDSKIPATKAQVRQLRDIVAREFNMTPKQVAKLKPDQLSEFQSKLVTEGKRRSANAEFISTMATQVQQRPTEEGLNKLQLLQQIGPERLDLDVEAGQVVIPKAVMWDKLSKDKDKLAAIIKENSGTFTDPEWVNKLQAGERLTQADIDKLPDTIVRDMQVPVKDTDALSKLMKAYPSIRVGAKQ